MTVVIIILTTVLIVSLFYNIKASRKVALLEAKIDSIARGDFTKTIDFSSMGFLTNLCKGFNKLLKNMRSLIASVSSATDHVTEYVAEITTNTEKIYNGATQNSKVISEIATSIESQSTSMAEAFQHTEKIEQDFNIIATKTEKAKGQAVSTRDTVEKSRHIFDQLIERMKKNANKSLELASKINYLESKAHTINTIVDSVNAISENTNLLALNASIEAARAGESGKGFAVVANEVKNLADQSTMEADKIRKLVQGIEREIAVVAEEIRSDSEKVKQDMNFANEAKDYFNTIVTSTEETLSSINAIYNLANEEADIVTNIKVFMESVVSTSQQTTAATQSASNTLEAQSLRVEEVFSSLKRLNSMTGEIKDVIQSFVKSYEIDASVQKIIDAGMNKLKEISNSNITRSFDRKACEDYLNDIIRKNKNFEVICLFNLKGDTVAIEFDETLKLNKTDLYENFSHREYFKEAINGRNYISEPYISMDSNNYCIAMSTPVKDISGEIVGVLMTDFAIG